MKLPTAAAIGLALLGPAFLLLWINAEIGRAGVTGTAILAGVVGIAIALSPWRPAVATMLVVAVPVIQLLGILPSFTSTDWPIAVGMLVPIAVIGYRGATRAMATAVIVAVAIGTLAFSIAMLDLLPGFTFADAMLRGGPTGNWLSWIGADASTLGSVRLATALQMWVISGVVAGIVWAAAAGVAARIRSTRDVAALHRVEVDLVEAQTERAVIGERARIARDVHDAMAHSLAIVIAQADGALASGAVDDADAALSTIAETARRALADVRDVLERIDGDGPALGAQDVPSLVEGIRHAGLDVRASITGDAALVPTSASLAGYRIVQEALTNALRHTAGPATVDLTIDWRGPGAVIAVASAGALREGSGGSGRGIVGMTERARMLGGWLSAGRNGDEFVVTATLPYPTSFAAAGSAADADHVSAEA